MTKSLLVTGGAGFIGSNFVHRAVDAGEWNVVVLDALTYAGNFTNIAALAESGRITFVKADICDEQRVKDVFNTHAIASVVHFAAESHVDRSILGPAEFLRTNVHGTYVLLEAARAAWNGDFEGKRFLHVSTDEVYGSLAPDDPGFTEDNPHRPNSPYSASKAAADHLARAWHHTFGLPTVVSNCSNNYGPRQFPEKLIPLFVLNALEGKELPVYGDGMQVRDWLHVDDHCNALLLLLERGCAGHVYVVGGDNERPNLEIIRLVCDAVDKQSGNADGTSRKLIRHVHDRAGHDRRYAIDATRIRTELGWTPVREFEAGIDGTVRWYRENRAWSDAIRSGDYVEYYKNQYGER